MTPITSHLIRSGIPSGPDATSREVILLVASHISSSVTYQSSVHPTIHIDSLDCSAALSSCEGKNVPMICSAGSISVVTRGSFAGNFRVTALYGFPHGSNSTVSTSSDQARSFAILISFCSERRTLGSAERHLPIFLSER